MLTKIAHWWLKRKGHYVVHLGSCQMVLSGYFLATQQDDGSYLVWPPQPSAYVVALNHTIVHVSKTARKWADGEVVQVGEDFYFSGSSNG